MQAAQVQPRAAGIVRQGIKRVVRRGPCRTSLSHRHGANRNMRRGCHACKFTDKLAVRLANDALGAVKSISYQLPRASGVEVSHRTLRNLAKGPVSWATAPGNQLGCAAR